MATADDVPVLNADVVMEVGLLLLLLLLLLRH
jgi:hypothetical protein